MSIYLTFDGGGSQSRALLFDEGGPLAFGRSGGTNTSSATLEDVRLNIASCLDQVFAGLPRPLRLEAAYVTLVGPAEVLREELARRAEVSRFEPVGEALAGMLAGALRPVGLVALSGTGSDAFYCAPDGRVGVVGALGPILGDDGSGAWIGQQAMRRALHHEEGWGEATAFWPLLKEAWGLSGKWDLVHRVHESPAPFRVVASAVPVVAEAARAGDALALSLFAQAGELMATQILALLRREGLLDQPLICVCCGGCWKGHESMYRAFAQKLAEQAPGLTVQKPVFEHLMSGVVKQRMEAQPGISPEGMLRQLSGPYAAYQIKW